MIKGFFYCILCVKTGMVGVFGRIFFFCCIAFFSFASSVPSHFAVGSDLVFQSCIRFFVNSSIEHKIDMLWLLWGQAVSVIGNDC